MKEIMKILNSHIETNRYISCLETIFVLFEEHNISNSDRKEILNKIGSLSNSVGETKN